MWLNNTTFVTQLHTCNGIYFKWRWCWNYLSYKILKSVLANIFVWIQACQVQWYTTTFAVTSKNGESSSKLLFMKYLSSFPKVTDLSLKLLTLKTIMLIALVTAQRGQSLHMLDMQFMTEFKDRFEFVLPFHVKQSRPGYEPPSIVLKAYPTDQSLCVFSHMKEYLLRTKYLRGSETRVLISLVKPYKHVSRDTISWWIRSVMKDAGIDVHSLSHTAPELPRLRRQKLQLSLFRRFNKPVQLDNYANAVLSTN